MKDIKRTIFPGIFKALAVKFMFTEWYIRFPLFVLMQYEQLMVWVRITLGFQPHVIRTQTINMFLYCMNKQGITNSTSG